jgi:hypothetical protein
MGNTCKKPDKSIITEEDIVLTDPEQKCDAKRGFFRMPDGTVRPILGQLASMSSYELSRWRYENNFTRQDRLRLYRALHRHRSKNTRKKQK